MIKEAPKKEIGIAKYYQPTLAEVKRGVHITRELFGLGQSGENSYRAVVAVRDIMHRQLMGDPVNDEEADLVRQDSCSYPSPDDPNRCGRMPTGTVNYDITGTESIVLTCSREHSDFIQKKIEEEVKEAGYITWPARNGWGRA